MKMKKIASGVVAAVLAVSLCVPAFAATPGEVAEDSALTVIGLTQNWKADASNAEKAKAEMEKMVNQLQDSDVTVSTYMTSAGLSYFDALEANGKAGTDYGQEIKPDADGNIQCVIRYEKTSYSVGGELSVSDDAGVITYTADPAHPSSTGYAITVYLPDNATATQYSVKMLGDNAQPNDTVVPVNSYLEEDGTVQKYVSFWVPHFTTYQLTAVTLNQPEQPSQQPSNQDSHPEIAEAIANGTWGQSTGSGTGSGAGSSNAVTGENPIKATGSAMDLGIVALAAVAAVAVCGVGIAAKKAHK